MTGPGWLDALAEEARRVLPAPMARYVDAGAREEVTRDEAASAWSAYRLWPRVLQDVSGATTATSVLGQDLDTPLAVAPSSMQRAAHPDGERAMARGAAAAGALHVVSSNAGFRFADLAADGPWWLQVYVPDERERVLPLVADAAAAGATALVLTVDTPYPGTKYHTADADWADIDVGWHRANLPGDFPSWTPTLTPDAISWLAERTGLPVVTKGVLRPDDAQRCLEAGAAAVYVSNHGGRQLDRGVATAHALPRVAEAVAGRVPVLVDGGVRSGLDALTALALGADLVLLGRPPLWALAAGGADGVRRLLAGLTEELLEALQLSGCRSVSDARGIAELDRANRP